MIDGSSLAWFAAKEILLVIFLIAVIFGGLGFGIAWLFF